MKLEAPSKTSERLSENSTREKQSESKVQNAKVTYSPISQKYSHSKIQAPCSNNTSISSETRYTVKEIQVRY